MARWIRLGVVLVLLLALVWGAWFWLDRLGNKTDVPKPTIDLAVMGKMGKTVKTFTVDFRNPLYGTEVGDWAIYRRMGGSLEKRVVVQEGKFGENSYRTDPSVVVLAIHASVDERKTWEFAGIQPHSRSTFGLGKLTVQAITRDDIECAGRTWRSWRVDGHYPGGVGGIIAWVTDQQPLGVLRIKARLRPEGVDDEFTYVYVEHGYGSSSGD